MCKRPNVFVVLIVFLFRLCCITEVAKALIVELDICFLANNVLDYFDIRVIQKVTAQTLVCILKEESKHQTLLCTKTRRKKIWTGV